MTAFVELVSQFPDLVEAVSSSGGTILAPSNDALETFVGTLGPQGLHTIPEDTLRSVLTYHVLPKTLKSGDLTGKGGGIAETSLQGPEPFANLDGKANVVFASAFGSSGLQGNQAGPLKIYSGVGSPASVSTADVVFDKGVIHVIESYLRASIIIDCERELIYFVGFLTFPRMPPLPL